MIRIIWIRNFSEKLDAFSRKWQKTAEKPNFGDKLWNYLDTHFFSKFGLRHFFCTSNRLTSCKKAKKSYGGKYDNFYRLTDGGRFKGPKCWSKKITMGSMRIFCYRQTDRLTDRRCWIHKDSRRVLTSNLEVDQHIRKHWNKERKKQGNKQKETEKLRVRTPEKLKSYIK